MQAAEAHGLGFGSLCLLYVLGFRDLGPYARCPILISPKPLMQDPSLSLGSRVTWATGEAQGGGSEAHSSNSELSKGLGNVRLR